MSKKHSKPSKFKVVISILIILSIVSFFAYNFGYNSLMETVYPQKFKTLVNEYGEDYELEPSLIYAVIKCESSFQTDAQSKAGAKGLMQLTDETFDDCVRWLSLEGEYDVFEPEDNIKFGTYYLSRLLDKYDGDLVSSLAAYNAGPSNVDKWIEAAKQNGGEFSQNDIQFGETKNYVEKVLKAKVTYEKLYFKK